METRSQTNDRSYCNKNGVTIYPVAIRDSTQCYIEINNNGRLVKGTNRYEKKILYERIRDLYTEYAKKIENHKSAFAKK